MAEPQVGFAERFDRTVQAHLGRADAAIEETRNVAVRKFLKTMEGQDLAVLHGEVLCGG